MSPPRTTLARILKEEGRRQSWLAEQVGVSRQRMSLIVNGLHCDDDLKQRIADVLERKAEDVFPTVDVRDAA